MVQVNLKVLVGGNAGMEQAGLPFEVRVGRINTYAYVGMVPKDAPPEAVMKAMGLLNRASRTLLSLSSIFLRE